jgi:uncharacterized protein (DUF885 family)
VAGDAVLALADELAGASLHHDPFEASYMGVSGYDDAVPDLSPEAQQRWRSYLVDTLVRCDRLESDADRRHFRDRILLAAVRDHAGRAVAAADSRVEDVAVSTMASGPAMALFAAASARVADAASASAFLSRCRRLPTYLDEHAERLRVSAASGFTPVAPLVEDVIRQLNDALIEADRNPFLLHQPPPGWDRGAAWRAELELVVRDEIRPAFARYTDVLREILSNSRRPERAGLVHVPGGMAAYLCCIRIGTTLALDADEIHRIGSTTLAEVTERMTEIGARLWGTRSADEVIQRMRDETATRTADGDLTARSADAIGRAEHRMAEIFRPPLPPPCAVQAMPAHLAKSGAPPMYRPPARDGSGAGAYLVNDVEPGAAASWGLEVAAFHEGVPGHHAQLARLQQVPDLPLLLSAFGTVPHVEGWGLYAEQLADELGLYSDDMQRLGMLAMQAWRAVRLVVDTGLHARGWSRARARRFALDHTPMPSRFVEVEIDRYIAFPGQALGYLIGQREINRLRREARSRLGAAFDLRDFHAAVLDHGSLPLPVLAEAVDHWTTSRSSRSDPP